MSFRPESTPRRRAGTEGQRFGEDFVVLDAEGRMLRGLNAVGAQVWALSDGTRTAREIATEVASAWAVDADQALVDCLLFLSQLVARGLVEELRPGPALQEVQR